MPADGSQTIDGFESMWECPDRSPTPRRYTLITVAVEGQAPGFVTIAKVKGLVEFSLTATSVLVMLKNGASKWDKSSVMK